MRYALLLIFLLLPLCRASISNAPCPVDTQALRNQTRAVFAHAYNAYKQNALPFDELRPLSCTGVNTFGNLTISLIDTLDTLAVLGEWHEFSWAVEYVIANVTFDQDETVSVFETTIRVLGALLSTHGILLQQHELTGIPKNILPSYNDELLSMAVDLADRLLPAFETETGIPFGAINLRHGVSTTESTVASTAGAGSLLLEFGTLSRYTRNATYYNRAFTAMQALHSRAASTGLVGNHIDVHTGFWVATESGVGGLVDSFYEYLIKGWTLFGDERLLTMFEQSYDAVRKFVHKPPWYLDAEMYSGHTVGLGHSSLSAFWPSLQVLVGHTRLAADTTRAHYAVWRRYGCLPESYHVRMQMPMPGQVNYPLRPELIESVFYLHWASDDPAWQGVGAAVLHSMESIMKVECGFAEVKHAAQHELGDIMPSFVMSETFKYLYLLFSDGEQGDAHWLRSGKYVLSTEAHPFFIPEEDISEIIGVHNNVTEEKQFKCSRNSRAEHYLPCGYGMHGKDHSKFDIRSVLAEAIDLDVSQLVDRRLERSDTPRIGEIFVGSQNVYRVANVIGEQVLLEKVKENETIAELERRKLEARALYRGCRRELLGQLILKRNVCWRGIFE